jgi:hypothetical protein
LGFARYGWNLCVFVLYLGIIRYNATHFIQASANNEYKLRAQHHVRLSSLKELGIVRFKDNPDQGMEAPDRSFIKVHAGFANVANISGLAQLYQNAEDDHLDNSSLCPGSDEGGADFGTRLAAKLAVLAPSASYL